MKYQIVPSILSADFTRLGDQLRELEEAGTEMIHFDVMDGSFVEEISFGEVVLRSVRPNVKMEIDVHLMVVDPLTNIDSFAKAGADRITFHLEAAKSVRECIDKIHAHGLKAAVSLKPCTPIEEVFPYLPDLEMVLVMTVNPGYGGQCFLPSSVERIQKLRAEIGRQGLSTDVQVDGGIGKKTIRIAKEAGANVFVCGSSVFLGSITDNLKALEESLR